MFTLVLILSFVYGGKTKYVAYIDQYKSMIDAATFCYNECRGSLLSIENRTMAVVPEVLPSNLGYGIFVGYHTIQSKWIEIYGCFEFNEALETNRAEKKKTYSDQEYKLLQEDEKGFAASCQLFCYPHVYMAKVGQTCLCFMLEPNSTLVDSKKCHVNGKLFNTENGYGIYFRARNIGTEIDNFYCAYEECDNQNQINERKAYCSSLMKSFCVDVQGNYTLQSGYSNWKDSLLQCIQNGDYLPRNSQIQCTTGNVEYWTGEFKYQGLVLDREQTSSVLTGYAKCGYIEQTESGFEFKLMNCYNSFGSLKIRRFLCEYANDVSVNSKCRERYAKILPVEETTTIKTSTTETTVSTTQTTDSTEKATTTTMGSTTEMTGFKTDLSLTYTTISSNVVNMSSTEGTIRNDMQQKNELGSIIGAALGVLVLVALISLAVIILLRRRKQKNVAAVKNKTVSNVFNTEVEYENANHATVNNVQIKPNSKTCNNSGVRANTETEYSNPCNDVSYPYECVKSPSPKEDETYYNVSNEENGKGDIYHCDLKEGEYDHLRNTEQHKEDREYQTLYDHTMASKQRSSDMYDHTVNNLTINNTDLYDHAVV